MKNQLLRALTLLVPVTVAAGLLPLVAAPASAAPGDCGFGGGAVATYTGPSGLWTTAASWDSGVVPNGQVCIPAGKTVTIDSNLQLGTETRVLGTLRIAGATSVNQGGAYSDGTLVVDGRFEIAAGTIVNLYYGTVNLDEGAVLRVEAGGTLNANSAINDLGGDVDLTGGGTLNMNGGNAVFNLGASTDGTPVQGTVTGGKLTLLGATLDDTSTGAAAFRTGGADFYARVTGTLAANQSIDVHCDSSYSTSLYVDALDFTSYGTIHLLPRGVSTCQSSVLINPGRTLTNHGTFTWGDAGAPADGYGLNQGGTFLNASDGTVVVNQTVNSQADVKTAGTWIVNPGGGWGQGNNTLFELQDGTITNHGSIGFYHANTYATAGIMRVLQGSVVGNPLIAQGYRFELIGTGAVHLFVPQGGGSILQNPNGPNVIHANQIVELGEVTSMSTVGDVENDGTILMAGSNDYGGTFGTSGDGTLTNHGTIRSAPRPGSGSGGIATIAMPLVNAADGQVLVGSGRSLQLYGVINHGLLDLGGSLFASGDSTWAADGTTRVHVSSAGSTELVDVRTNSTLGGTLDIVTDAGNPPTSGQSIELMQTRALLHYYLGTFTNVTGDTPGAGLGYALTYEAHTAHLKVVPSVKDLIVGDATGSSVASIGDGVSASWTTTVGATTSTAWTDSVFLSGSPQLDASAVLVGRFSRTGTATADVARYGSLSFTVPTTAIGRHYVVIVADSAHALAADRVHAIASFPITINPGTLTVGNAAGNVSIPADGSRLLRLSGSPASDVVVTYSPTSPVRAFGAYNRVPSEADHDLTPSSGTMTFTGPGATVNRYVLLRNTSASPATVSIGATAPGVSITATTPMSVLAGSPAATAVTVDGTGFQATDKATLTCGATTVQPTSTQVDSSQRLTSLFALPTALGACSVNVGTATKANALTVSAPAVRVNTATLAVDVSVDGPALVRSGVDNPVIVRWTNRTAYSLPAELVQVSVDNGGIRFADHPGIGARQVDVLTISGTGPAGILAPGASGSTKLIVHGIPAHQTVGYFTSRVDRTKPEDVGSDLIGGLPDASTAAKAWVKTNGPAMIGLPGTTTAGALETHLATLATRLSFLGRRTSDVARLLSADIDRITAGGRLVAFENGEFGKGQRGPSFPHLAVEVSTGDAVITMGGARVRFAHETNGTYSSPAGEGDLLSKAGSAWNLTARSGTRRAFGADGTLTSLTDPYGRVTTYTWSGGKIATVSTPDGDFATFTHDGAGRITAETHTTPGDDVTYTYDAGGHMSSTTGSGVTVAMTWDANDQPLSSTGPDGTTTTVARDAYGRVTALSRNGTLVQSTSYNADGSITSTDAVGGTATAWIDDGGNVARTVDTAGRITTVRRNADGDVIGQLADGVPIGETTLTNAAGIETGSVDALGNTTAVTHDVDGNLSSVTDPLGHRTAVLRGDGGVVTAITDPLGRSTAFTYDALGRVSSTTDRSGRHMTSTYSGDDLASQVTTGAGSTTFGYDSAHRLTTATGPMGTTTYTYDSAGRITSVAYPTGLSLAYTYDTAGRITSTTTGDGQVSNRTYNARGLLATVSAGATVVSTYSYDGIDRLTAIANSNGTHTERTYDDLDHLSRETTTCCTAGGTTAGSTVISDVQLTYDPQDRIATRTDAAGVTTYGYDADNRLTSSTTTGASPRTITWTYDAAGNRITQTDSATTTNTTVIGASGRPTSIGGDVLTHDADGRVLTRGGDAYTWDPKGQLASTTGNGSTATYTYDAVGNPLTRTVDGVTTKLLIDGTGTLLAEYSNAGTRTAGYVWGQGLATRLSGAGTPTSWYATDPRGDVVALTGAAGAVTDAWTYLPFGGVSSRTGTTDQPFAFQGLWGLRTEATGLVSDRARTYDPITGRFLSEDGDLFASDNAYTYTSSDPINRTDLNGDEESQFITDLWNPAAASGFADGQPVNNLATLTGHVSTASNLVSELEVSTNLKAGYQNIQEGDALMAKFWKTIPPPPPAPDKAVYTIERSLLDQNKLIQRANMQNQAKTFYREAAQNARTAKAFKYAGKGFWVLGAASNVTAGWEAFKTNPSFANGVRQASKAFLKTVLPPLWSLAFDTIEAGVDEASLLGFQKAFGVDPVKLYNETGWNARYEIWKKKHPRSGSGDSADPNAMIGPAGVTVGNARFVARGDDQPWEIQFENQASASLPANKVVVTQTLDADLDLESFALGDITIAGHTWSAPSGVRSWSTVLDDTAHSGLDIAVKARLDVGTRIATWTLTGLDPATGDVPTDTAKGFLPPDDANGTGQGAVTYRVRVPGSTADGTTVAGQASIVFDANAAIPTNTDTVTIDASAPAAAPTATSPAANPIPVQLGTTDAGSGVAETDLYASKDGADFDLVATHLTTSSYDFTADAGAHYVFRVLSTDNVGNVGELSAPTASVTLGGNSGGGGGGGGGGGVTARTLKVGVPASTVKALPLKVTASATGADGNAVTLEGKNAKGVWIPVGSSAVHTGGAIQLSWNGKTKVSALRVTLPATATQPAVSATVPHPRVYGCTSTAKKGTAKVVCHTTAKSGSPATLSAGAKKLATAKVRSSTITFAVHRSSLKGTALVLSEKGKPPVRLVL